MDAFKDDVFRFPQFFLRQRLCVWEVFQVPSGGSRYGSMDSMEPPFSGQASYKLSAKEH